MPIKMALKRHVCDKKQPALYPSKLQCYFTNIILYSLEPLPSSTSIKFYMLISFLEHQIGTQVLRMYSMFVVLLYPLISAHISWLVQAAWFRLVCCWSGRPVLPCYSATAAVVVFLPLFRREFMYKLIKDNLKVNSC